MVLDNEKYNQFVFFRIVDSKPHSRMWYRIGAVRNMTGGRKTQPANKMNDKLKEVIFSPFYDHCNQKSIGAFLSNDVLKIFRTKARKVSFYLRAASLKS